MKIFFLLIVQGLTLFFSGLISQTLVANLNPGGGDSFPNSIYPFKGEVVFAANDGFNGTQLYYTDGTTAGTVMLTALPMAPSSLFSFDYQYGTTGGAFVEIDSLGYFFAISQTNGYSEIYKTDGTAIGTETICPEISFVNASRIFKMENKICAILNLVPGGYNLFSYDPSDGSSSLLPVPFDLNYLIKDDRVLMNMQGTAGIISDPYIFNDKLYYFNSVDNDLKSINLTGTITIEATFPVHCFGDKIILNDKLIFRTATFPTPSIGDEPYYFDFTNNSYGLLKDINPYFNYNSDVEFMHFHFMDERNHTQFYFYAQHEDYGVELWASNGTTAGTHLVIDENIGPSNGPIVVPDVVPFYRGDTLSILESGTGYRIQTNGIVIKEIDNSAMLGFDGTEFKWNQGGYTYALNSNGIIWSVLDTQIVILDTLDKLNCASPSAYYFTLTEVDNGTIFVKGCDFYLSYEDCLFTGFELYEAIDILCSLYLSIPSYHEKESSTFFIYPNPAISQIQIGGFSEEIKMIKIYSLDGREVYSQKDFDDDFISVSFLESGSYIVFVETQNGNVFSERFVKL